MLIGKVGTHTRVAPHWMQTITEVSETVSDNEKLYLQLCWNVCLDPLWGIHTPYVSTKLVTELSSKLTFPQMLKAWLWFALIIVLERQKVLLLLSYTKAFLYFKKHWHSQDPQVFLSPTWWVMPTVETFHYHQRMSKKLQVLDSNICHIYQFHYIICYLLAQSFLLLPTLFLASLESPGSEEHLKAGLCWRHLISLGGAFRRLIQWKMALPMVGG